MALKRKSSFFQAPTIFTTLIIVCCILVLAYIILVKRLDTTSRSQTGYMLSQTRGISANETSSVKTILLWNRFFLSDDYGIGFGVEPLKGYNCPKTCYITSDKRLLSKADAVVIHSFYLEKDVPNATLPTRTHKNQVFVFLLMENPFRSYSGLVLLNYVNIFNLTMTYLDDPRTDVIMHYGKTTRFNETKPELVPGEEYIRKKKYQVVWLVSNCNAPSYRYAYAEKLSKYTQLDILGRCGEDICPKGIKCMDFLEKDYRFYLAFENGFCKDYITEKAFKSLEAKIVPIVYGGGNYSRFLPPHSSIDVRDYSTPKKLAEYLDYLKNNVTAYMEYFLWKKDYFVRNTQWYRYESFCKLCQLLNINNYPFKTNFNPLTYWRKDMCLYGEREKKAVHLE